MPKQFPKYLGYFGGKNGSWELLKNAQSGHAAPSFPFKAYFYCQHFEPKNWLSLLAINGCKKTALKLLLLDSVWPEKIAKCL